MKKVISVILCAVLLAGTTILSTDAAANGKSAANYNNFTSLEEIKLSDCRVRFYTYNFTQNSPRTGIKMYDKTFNAERSYYFNDNISGYRQINVSGTSNYEHWLILNRSSSGTQIGRYNNTGGVYEKIRLKLSDYSDYFNSDGTHTKNGFKYNFSTQKSGTATYNSALVFWSGGIFTAVTPDKNGYAEFYVCKNIGVEPMYFTNFEYIKQNGIGSGGGVNGGYFSYFIMGDTDLNSNVSVNDVTALQTYSAGMESFGKLQKRNADVNLDGKINVDDATMIQKYIAGMI